MVQDSYLHEQQQQQQQQQQQHLYEKDHDLKHHLFQPPPPPPPRQSPTSLYGLTKYGPLVRVLPEPTCLLGCLCPRQDQVELECTSSVGEVVVTGPTPSELIRHLFKHCPFFRVEQLSWGIVDLEDNLFKTIVESVVPRTRSIIEGRLRIPDWKLRHVLDHCSNHLEELDVNFEVCYSTDEKNEEQELTTTTTTTTTTATTTTTTTTPWTNLKRLNLNYCYDDTKRSSGGRFFWPWLWKRCGQVKQLRIGQIGGGIEKMVAEEMLDFMPKVDEIWFSKSFELGDQEIATILSKPRLLGRHGHHGHHGQHGQHEHEHEHGWKVVQIGHSSPFNSLAIQALLKHCTATLERFEAYGDNKWKFEDIVQILASSPRLQTLCYPTMMISPLDFPARTFIDQDPDTGLLRPWACESTLKELNLLITGIPRPRSGFEEAYPGEGQEIQSLVYDRLGRLTHLEVLCLENRRRDYKRRDCLEMSMKSGLHKLSGLKALKVLDVSRLETLIGVEEVQWMTEQWPELSVLYGLERSEEDCHMEAVEWLKINCPRIDLRKQGWLLPNTLMQV